MRSPSAPWAVDGLDTSLGESQSCSDEGNWLTLVADADEEEDACGSLRKTVSDPPLNEGRPSEGPRADRIDA